MLPTKIPGGGEYRYFCSTKISGLRTGLTSAWKVSQENKIKITD